MSDTCRICRGGASEDRPLLYPCKCRGSIKYIHQDCLIEWLNHSQKAAKCDICNVHYKFTTIYDDDTPETVPMLWIFRRTVQQAALVANAVLIVVNTLVFVVFQIPIFFKLSSRVATWIYDQRLPYPQSIDKSWLYGDHYLFNRETPTTRASSPVAKLLLAFHLTWINAFVYLALILLLVLALMFTYESVVRDSGFEKLKKRSRKSRPKLSRADIQALAAGVRRFNQRPGRPEPNEVFMRGRAADLNVNGQRDLFGDEPAEEPLAEAGQPEFEEFDTEHERNRRIEEIVNTNEVRPDFGDAPAFGLDPIERQEAEIEADEIFDALQVEAVIQPDEIEDPEAPAPPVVAMQANNNPDNFLINLTVGLSAVFPIKLAFTADAIITGWIAICYLLASCIGKNVIQIGHFLLVLLLHQTKVLESLKVLLLVKLQTANRELYDAGASFIDTHCQYNSNFAVKSVYIAINMVQQTVYVPIQTLFSNIINSHYPPTFWERFTPFAICYSILGTSLYILMQYLGSLQGDKHYRLWLRLFEVKCTLKVVLVFMVELIGFPIYSGFLMDFSIAPVVLTNFQFDLINRFDPSSTVTKNVFRVFALNELDLLMPIRGFFKTMYFWLLGTSYMYILSFFVGMTRSHILRPGVLYFIRSPDDHNAHLLRHSLVRPLSLQLSRIALSGAIYSVLIIVCVGGVNFLLRFGLPLVLSNNASPLPIRIPELNFNFLMLTNPIIWKLLSDSSLITKYIRLYWQRAFQLSCRSLRLSSFILDIDNPQERGRVVYRSLFHKVLTTQIPDYKQPCSQYNVKAYFETHPQVNAVFVPDGNFVRAPDNETINRRLLKEMFVPVTKDNVLLGPIKETEEPLDDLDTDSDEESLSPTTHTVVYRAPNFKLRIMGLLLYLWLFGAVLIVVVAAVASGLGKWFTGSLCKYGRNKIVETAFGAAATYCTKPLEMDFISLTFGLMLLNAGMHLFEAYSVKKRLEQVEIREVPLAAETIREPIIADEEEFGDEADVLGGEIDQESHWKQSMSARLRVAGEKASQYFMLILVNVAFHGLAFIKLKLAHSLSVNLPYVYLTGDSEEFFGNTSLIFNKFTLPVHLIVFYYAIIPEFGGFLKITELNEIFERYATDNVYNNYLKPISLDFMRHEAVYYSLAGLGYLAITKVTRYLTLNTRFNDPVCLHLYRLLIASCFPSALFVCMSIKVQSAITKYYHDTSRKVKDEYYGKVKKLENMEVEES